MKTLFFSTLLLAGCFTPARETPTQFVDRLMAECAEANRRLESGLEVEWCVKNRIVQAR
jgi:hypothetical protein